MTVRIIHGANEGQFALAGQTVRSIARSLRDAFNIPEDAQAFVGGTEVNRDHVVSDGDTVEFVRTFGRKGGLHDFWSVQEITALLGSTAVHDMAEMEIVPVSQTVFTSQQVNEYLGQLGNRQIPERNRKSIIVDFESMTLTCLDQGPYAIDKTMRFRLLNRLAVRPNFYVHIDTLKRDVWKDELVDDETVNRTARRLRETLKKMQIEGVELKTSNGNWALTLRRLSV